MKVNTKKNINATKGFEQLYFNDELEIRMFHIIRTGKQRVKIPVQEPGIVIEHEATFQAAA